MMQIRYFLQVNNIYLPLFALWAFWLLLSSFAPAATVIEARNASIRSVGEEIPGGIWNLWSNGRVGQHLRFAKKGTYEITVRAYGSPAAGQWPEMGLLIDGISKGTLTVDQPTPKDYRYSIEIPAGNVEVAVAFLNDMVTDNEDRNLYLDRITISAPPGITDPAALRPDDMTAEYERREQAVLADSDQAIEKHRKSDAMIRLVDARGKPLAGAKVKIELKRHDFLFGCNLYMFDQYPTASENAAYKQRFAELFNYATTGLYWRWYEPKQGKPDYPFTDKVVSWCAERGIRLKGHPLLWGDEAGIPAWSQGQPPLEVQRRRIFDIMQRYHGKIDFWEVVNEPTLHSEPKIEQPYRWAREADPTAYLIINEAHVLADGRPQFFLLLREAKEHAVPFDGIGIQAHEPAGMWFPLDRVQNILDQYATLGKELHITEFMPTSGGEPIVGSHRQGIWDDAAQAEYAVKFYRVCFAHPAVRAITWWDFSDRNSWRKGGGMLRADLSPKPVYDELKRLIHDTWNTRAAGQTDAIGRFAFRGFYGTYRIIVELPEKKVEKEFHLQRGKEKDIVISAISP